MRDNKVKLFNLNTAQEVFRFLQSTENKPGELCYELQGRTLYSTLNHCPDSMPSDTLATMLYANHWQ